MVPGHNFSQKTDNQIQKLGIHEDQNARKNITKHAHKLTNLTHNQKERTQSVETDLEITVCIPSL